MGVDGASAADKELGEWEQSVLGLRSRMDEATNGLSQMLDLAGLGGGMEVGDVGKLFEAGCPLEWYRFGGGFVFVFSAFEDSCEGF